MNLKPTGKSMGTVISSKKLVKISPVSFDELKIGDLVFVKISRKGVLHYLLLKHGKKGLTWGEANNYFDGWFSSKLFLGKVKRDFWPKLALVYLFEWERVASELKKKSIDYLILKGPLWQKKYFGCFPNKPFIDLDVLISRDNYFQAKRILNSQGWKIKIEQGVECEHCRGNDPVAGEISFIKKKVELKIDLHLEPFAWTSGQFFQWPFNKKKIQKISKELMKIKKGHFLEPTEWLFYASLNFFLNHNMRGIWQLADIANIVLNKKINWKKLWQLADSHDCLPIVKLNIYWVRRMFGLKNNFEAPGGKIVKLFINEKTFFKPINPILERKKNLYLNTILRFLLWPVPVWRKAAIMARFIFSSRFWRLFFVYFSLLPPLSILAWKTCQWWRGRLFQLRRRVFQIYGKGI